MATLGSGSGLLFAGLSNCGHGRAAPGRLAAGCWLLAAGCRLQEVRESQAVAIWVSGESGARALSADACQSKHPADDRSGTLERPLVLSRWPSPQPVSHSDFLPGPCSMWGTIL